MNHSKKIAVYMLILLLFSGVGCGIEDINENAIKRTETTNIVIIDENIVEKKQIESLENTSQQSFFDEETEQLLESNENNYKSILLGNRDFICTDLENQSLNITQIRQAVTDYDSITVNPIKFVVIDLDGDSKEEIVLWLQVNGIFDYGFEILHYQNEEIYGYTLPYRVFMNLKTDGTFLFEGSADDFGIGKLIFSTTGYSISEQVYSQLQYNSNNILAIQYFANGETCSEDEFNDAINSQEQKTDVTWHDLSAENINNIFRNLS